MSRWAAASRVGRPEIPFEAFELAFPDVFGKQAKGRRTDRGRVSGARAALAKLPENVSHYTRAETAAMLGCSVRQVQRKEERGLLVPRPRHGADVTYDGRDVRRLASAMRKER